MHIRFGVYCTTLTAALGLTACAALNPSGTGTTQSQAMAAAERQGSMYVACQVLPLHRQASGYAETLTVLKFGNEVTVLEVSDLYRLEEGGDELPTWARVKAKSSGQTGYVAARCLVNQAMLPSQAPDAAREGANTEGADEAGRGFSDYEEGDLFAMQGAHGQAVAGDANYPAIDGYLQQQQVSDPGSAYRDFRRTGGLGRTDSQSKQR